MADILDELDAIQKMTPDETYAKSVSEIGRAEGITDDQDAAARIPQAQIDAAKANVVAPASTQPAATPSASSVPASTPVTLSDDKQFGRQTFGSFVRVTNQKTGAVTWEDLNGNAVEAPKSMQMMDAINGGYSPNRGTARNWDEAIKLQNGERVAKANAYAQRMIQSNQQAREQRAMRRNKQNAMTGDLVGAAMADLAENLKLAQAGAKSETGLAEAEGGRIHKAKDGNFYVRGIVRPEALDGFNAESGKYGGRDKAERIVASQRVDKYGNPVGDPTFSVLYSRNGILNDKGDGVYAKTLTLGQAVDSVYKAQVAMGMPELDAKNYATRQFGGANPFNWKLEEAAPASVQAAQVRAGSAKEVQELKNKGAAAVAAEKGRSSEEVARINGEYQKQVAEIASRAKNVAQTNGKITGNDIASLLKVASDPLASADIRQSALETATLLQERLNGAAGAADADKDTIKSGDNGGWKDGVEYVEGMEVPVGGSVKRGGKTYYMWSDGNFHSTKEATK